MVAADNPGLPLSMIEGILEAREEFRADLGKPYEWGVTLIRGRVRRKNVGDANAVGRAVHTRRQGEAPTPAEGPTGPRRGGHATRREPPPVGEVLA